MDCQHNWETKAWNIKACSKCGMFIVTPDTPVWLTPRQAVLIGASHRDPQTGLLVMKTQPG